MKIKISLFCAITALSVLVAQAAQAQRGADNPVTASQSPRNPAAAPSAADRDTHTRNKTAEQKVPWVTPPPGNLDGLDVKGRKEIGLEVFTDANGKVNKVNVTKSTGNPEVDKRVISWAMSKWSGPKSAKAKIPGYVGQ